jgi:hypothetical protein
VYSYKYTIGIGITKKACTCFRRIHKCNEYAFMAQVSAYNVATYRELEKDVSQ